MRKNYFAAQYAQSIEQKELDDKIKKKRNQELYGSVKPVLNQYSDKWANKFTN